MTTRVTLVLFKVRSGSKVWRCCCPNCMFFLGFTHFKYGGGGYLLGTTIITPVRIARRLNTIVEKTCVYNLVDRISYHRYNTCSNIFMLLTWNYGHNKLFKNVIACDINGGVLHFCNPNGKYISRRVGWCHCWSARIIGSDRFRPIYKGSVWSIDGVDCNVCRHIDNNWVMNVWKYLKAVSVISLKRNHIFILYN